MMSHLEIPGNIYGDTWISFKKSLPIPISNKKQNIPQNNKCIYYMSSSDDLSAFLAFALS